MPQDRNQNPFSEAALGLPSGTRALAPVQVNQFRPQAPTPAKPLEEFLQHVRNLRRNAWILAAMTVLGGLAGFVYMLYQPVEYSSTAVLDVQGFNESFMNFDRLDPQAGLGNYSATTMNLQTQLRLLTSPTLLGRVRDLIRSEGLDRFKPRVDRYAMFRRWLRHDDTTDSLMLRRALVSAASSVTPRLVPGTRLIEISCESEVPDVSAAFVNRLIAEYLDQSLMKRTQGVQQTSEWINTQVEETHKQLIDSEAKLQAFVTSQGLMFASPKATLAESKLQQLQEQLAQIQADRIAKQSRWDMVRSAQPEALGELLDDPALKAFQSELAGLRRQEAELGVTLNAGHPKMQKLKAQIEELESQIRLQRENMIRRVQGEFESAKSRERMLSGAYGGETREVASQSEKAAEYANLKREAEAARLAYNSILDRQKQTSMAAVLPTTNIRVVDMASPAQLSFKPKPQLLIAWGMALGLMISVAFVFIRTAVSRGILRPGDASELLQMRELGTIPAASEMIRVSVAGGDPSGSTAKDGKVELASHLDRETFLAESFRNTLASILFENADGWKPHVIVVTSAAKEEGKTMIVSNLAITIAQTGRRVVLVDADLKGPRIQKIFDLPESAGVAQYAEGLATVDAVTQQTSLPNLWVVTAGAPAVGVGPVAYSRRLPELIAQLRRKFDVVLIDTPPILQFVDARVFGRLSDGVILVARSGVTAADKFASAREMLTQDGTPIIGSILNQWKPTASEKRNLRNSYKYYSANVS